MFTLSLFSHHCYSKLICKTNKKGWPQAQGSYYCKTYITEDFDFLLSENNSK